MISALGYLFGQWVDVDVVSVSPDEVLGDKDALGPLRHQHQGAGVLKHHVVPEKGKGTTFTTGLVGGYGFLIGMASVCCCMLGFVFLIG